MLGVAKTVSVKRKITRLKALTMNAALKTDNVKALEDRYGVTMPEGLRSQTEKPPITFHTSSQHVIRKSVR